MNNKLGPFSRQAEIVARLEEIASYLEENLIEVMVVAGDVFSEYTKYEQLQQSIAELDRIFRPFLRRGGTIVAVSGNHDNTSMFTALQSTLNLAGATDGFEGEVHPSGRLYLAPDPGRIVLKDSGGQRVQFALLPYPTAANYLKGTGTRYRSYAERSRSLRAALLDQLAALGLQSEIPTVLVAHLHVLGEHEHTLYGMTNRRQDVVFEPGEILSTWDYDYVALGHIHKPQTLTGLGHVRYSGSVERFNLGESEDDKGVWLVDVGERGLDGEPRWLPLDAAPVYKVELSDASAALQGLPDLYPDAERALVAVSGWYRPGEQTRDEIVRELNAIFPRCYRGPDIVPLEYLSEPSQSVTDLVPEDAVSEVDDVPGTVHRYLEDNLQGHPDLADLLALAEAMLVEEGARE
jgi:exonuclease SbcD